DAELDLVLGQPLVDLIEQEVLRLRCRIFVGEVLGSCCGSNAKPPMTAYALTVGELERRDREECLAREASWDRLGGFDKPLRVGMGGEERSERLGLAGSEVFYRTEKLQKLLAGADREAIGGVHDDVGVVVLAQMEADCHSPRPGLRVVVGDVRQ